MKKAIDQIKIDYRLMRKSEGASKFSSIDAFFESQEIHDVQLLVNELITESPERKYFPIDSFNGYEFVKK